MSLECDQDAWKHTHIYRKKDKWVLSLYSSHHQHLNTVVIIKGQEYNRFLPSIFNIRMKADRFWQRHFFEGHHRTIKSKHVWGNRFYWRHSLCVVQTRQIKVTNVFCLKNPQTIKNKETKMNPVNKKYLLLTSTSGTPPCWTLVRGVTRHTRCSYGAMLPTLGWNWHYIFFFFSCFINNNLPILFSQWCYSYKNVIYKEEKQR